LNETCCPFRCGKNRRFGRLIDIKFDSRRRDVVRRFYQSSKIALETDSCVDIEEATNVLGRVGNPFEFSGDIRTIEATPDIVLSELLRTMANLLEERCVRQ
jgi:hypothetical protein